MNFTYLHRLKEWYGRQFWYLKELVEAIGCPPERIFVEMARDDECAKVIEKTVGKKKLLELYKNCRKEERDWSKEIDAREEAEYKSKKLYLILCAKGKMYVFR